DLADALPSRYRQAVIEKLRNAAPVHWCLPNTARSKGIIVARLIRRRNFLQSDQRRALIATKRVRLIVPIHVAQARGVAVRVMLGCLVILENLLKRVWLVARDLFHADAANCNMTGCADTLRE